MLRFLPAKQIEQVAQFVWPDHSNWPLPPLVSAMREARDWAAWQDDEIVEAVAMAGFEAMRPDRQRAFIAHITKQVELAA